MRSFQHWTPRYLWNRTREQLYRRRHPGLPWLTPTANQILDGYLKDTDQVLEFGSGRSTVWFARRVAAITSVEYNPAWFERVEQLLQSEGLKNTRLLLRPKESDDRQEGVTSAYVHVLDDFSPASLDFVLVDGTYRSACAWGALERLRPGGLLVIDNVNWFLPCVSHAPNSRTVESGPSSPLWEKFWLAVTGWRRIWTSNGVSDTAFFFKPGL